MVYASPGRTNVYERELLPDHTRRVSQNRARSATPLSPRDTPDQHLPSLACTVVNFLVEADVFSALVGRLRARFGSAGAAAAAAFLGRPRAFLLGLTPETVFLGLGAARSSACCLFHSLTSSLGAYEVGSQVGEYRRPEAGFCVGRWGEGVSLA